MSELSPFPPGTVIADRYRVIGTLGAGGMGLVFEVEHVGLGRRFALKVLRLGRYGEELVQRFQREARALARLHTPRVAQVTDFGVDPEAGPYYVMELVEGETLEQRLVRGGALPLDEAITVAIELAEALADVHAAELVHRDLKPGNIGLTTGPIPVRLLDFGLAASVDDRFLERITRSQQILGSMPYMAPEQFTGARPDPAQDMWALGVVLFEMVTGQMPFEAPSSAALMHQILTAPVPSTAQHGFAVPAAIESALGALLQKEPSARVASARQAAEMLTALRISPIAPTVATAQAFPPTRAMPSHVGSSPGAMATAPDVPLGINTLDATSSTTVPPTTGASPAPPRRPNLGVLMVGGVALAIVSGLTISTALHLFEARVMEDGAAIEPTAAAPAPPVPAAGPTELAATERDAGARDAGDDAGPDATNDPTDAAPEPEPSSARAPPASTMRRRRSNERPAPATMAASPMAASPMVAMDSEGSWTGFIIEDPE